MKRAQQESFNLIQQDHPKIQVDYQFANGTIEVKEYDHIVGHRWLIDRFGNIEEL